MGNSKHLERFSLNASHLHPRRTQWHPRNRQTSDIGSFCQKTLNRRSRHVPFDHISLHNRGMARSLLRADKPLKRRLTIMDEPLRQESPLDEDWEEIARVANTYLDCKLWAPPPWTSQQWGVLAGVIDMACSGGG